MYFGALLHGVPRSTLGRFRMVFQAVLWDGVRCTLDGVPRCTLGWCSKAYFGALLDDVPRRTLGWCYKVYLGMVF